MKSNLCIGIAGKEEIQAPWHPTRRSLGHRFTWLGAKPSSAPRRFIFGVEFAILLVLMIPLQNAPSRRGACTATKAWSGTCAQ